MSSAAIQKTRGLDDLEDSLQEQIANLAYQLWQARGCPEGSPEEDWYRAEEQLRNPGLAL